MKTSELLCKAKAFIDSSDKYCSGCIEAFSRLVDLQGQGLVRPDVLGDARTYDELMAAWDKAIVDLESIGQ